MAAGTNTTADTLAARFQYPAMSKGKAKGSGKPPKAKGKAGSGKSSPKGK